MRAWEISSRADAYAVGGTRRPPECIMPERRKPGLDRARDRNTARFHALTAGVVPYMFALESAMDSWRSGEDGSDRAAPVNDATKEPIGGQAL